MTVEGVCGLKNLGSTCFQEVKSLLQGLVFETDNAQELYPSTVTLKIIMEEMLQCSHVYECHLLLVSVLILSFVHCVCHVVTVFVVGVLPVQNLATSKWPLYRRNVENDPHEFLLFLLRSLHNELMVSTIDWKVRCGYNPHFIFSTKVYLFLSVRRRNQKTPTAYWIQQMMW